MRLSFLRSMRFVSAVALVAAASVGFAQAPAQHVQVPQAPSGGLDSSKLPDVIGIHLGMTVPQAMAAVKAKYPADGITLFYAKIQNVPDAPWISRITGAIHGTGNNQANLVDQITVTFNAPPNTQVVVKIDRAVNIIPPTTIGNLEDALVQKYGPSMIQKNIVANLSWEFDEQGKATTVPGSYICTSFNQPAGAMPGGPAQAGQIQFGGPFQPPVDTQIPRLVNMCKDVITITTLLDPHPANPNQLVSNYNISLVDHAEDLRDFIASSEYGEKATAAAAAAAKQQQMKNAQPAPKL